VRVLFVHFGDGTIGESEFSLLQLMSSLSQRGVDVRLQCNTDSIENAARQCSITVYRGNYAPYFDYSSSAFSLRAYLGAVSTALRLLSEVAPDLVHCNSAEPAQWMRLASWFKRTPMLVHLHGRYLPRSRYVLGLHLADRIVGVTHAMIGPLRADGVADARLGVVYNGFDPTSVLAGDAAELRADLGIPPNAVVGAIAGGLLRLKGHDLLFAAMRELGPLKRPFHLLVMGEGRERERLEQLASGLPVHFLGQRADVGAIFRDAADFVIAPSRHEGFGRVIIEAALAGIPAIGARVGGIPEAIEEGSTGFLVAPISSAPPAIPPDPTRRAAPDPDQALCATGPKRRSAKTCRPILWRRKRRPRRPQVRRAPQRALALGSPATRPCARPFLSPVTAIHRSRGARSAAER
jgi:glycosyltransferase involved in cell wall biosynthesis